MQIVCVNYLQNLWQTICARRISKEANCPRCRDLDEHAAIEDQLHQIAGLLGFDAEELRASRHALKETPCQQCTLYLLLKAIDISLPVEDIPQWIESPNPALGNQTPLQCIQAGQYDDVIDALWPFDGEGSGI